MRAAPRKAGAPLSEERAWHLIDGLFKRRSGICNTIDVLSEYGAISERTAATMRARVEAEHEARGYDGGLWFLGPLTNGAPDPARRAFATQCRLQAARKEKP